MRALRRARWSPFTIAGRNREQVHAGGDKLWLAVDVLKAAIRSSQTLEFPVEASGSRIVRLRGRDSGEYRRPAQSITKVKLHG
jgi:hypothetical protein